MNTALHTRAAPDAPAALETRALVKRFGGIVATDDVSFRLEPGARHALIGPNGAGKTTFVNLLTGVLTPSGGSIVLAGEEVTRLRSDQRVRRGLARTFQINQLFADMTPLEALALAVSERRGEGSAWWRRIGGEALTSEVAEIAERFRLADVLGERTGSLAYGKQRLLEIALAFAAQPRVLLLDEPAAGVPQAERQELVATIAALPREVSVLLIEHDMDLIFAYADRISVLVNGALLTEGPAEAVAKDERVRAVYLGEERHG
jgi:branched-chain amino acid transport system ATP-binding protein